MENNEQKIEPLIIEGAINYKFKIDVENGKVAVSWEDTIGNNLASILIARELSVRLKSDIQQFKSKRLIPNKEKTKINGRLDKVTNSIMSLSLMTDDMVSAVLQMSIPNEQKESK